jgi:hypothetical protein
VTIPTFSRILAESIEKHGWAAIYAHQYKHRSTSALALSAMIMALVVLITKQLFTRSLIAAKKPPEIILPLTSVRVELMAAGHGTLSSFNGCQCHLLSMPRYFHPDNFFLSSLLVLCKIVLQILTELLSLRLD